MYKNILLAVDLGDDSSWRHALPEAVQLTRASGGNLHILTVVPDFGMTMVGQFFPKNYEKNVAGKVMAALHTFVEEYVPDDINVQHIVGEGKIYEVILDMAQKIAADLIIVTAGRADLKDFLLGPNAARVVRHANSTVLVVREKNSD